MKIPRTFFKRGTALLLALIMCLGMLPPALAAELPLAGDAAPAASEAIAPKVVMAADGKTATVTYTRPGVKTNLHVICLVDTSIDNPEAARIMSREILPACDKLRSGSASGTTADTIIYQNTVQVLSEGSDADEPQLIGRFPYGGGQSNETAALDKALEIINSMTGKTPVLFWVPAPAKWVDSSYELQSRIIPKLEQVQTALKAKGGELIVWQMGGTASQWIKDSTTHANCASKEAFQAQVQDSLAKVVHDYIGNFSVTLNLDTTGGLAQSISGVTLYDVGRNWTNNITGRSFIQDAKTENTGTSVTVTIPKLPDWMELEISLTVELNSNIYSTFDEQDIVGAASAAGTHSTGIFDEKPAALPSFQAARGSRAAIVEQTATFKPGSVEGTDLTTKAYPGDYVNLPNISVWNAGDKTFSGWLTKSGVFYKPGETIRMPEGGVTLTAVWGEADIQLRLGDVMRPSDYGNKMYGGDTSGGVDQETAWKRFLGELKWRCGIIYEYNNYSGRQICYPGYSKGEVPAYATEAEQWTVPEPLLDNIVSVTVIDELITFKADGKLWDTGTVGPGITFDADGDRKEESGQKNAVYIGLDEKNPVVAYVLNNETDPKKYDLYIAGKGGVTAPPCLSGLFSTEDSGEYAHYGWTPPWADGMEDVPLPISKAAPWLSLKEVDLQLFDTSETTDMSYMFYNGYYRAPGNATNINFGAAGTTNFKTSNVTDMSYMFFNYRGDNTGSSPQASTILDLSCFDTSNVTNMSHMFTGCTAKTLNLSSFNTSNVTDMLEIFNNCKADSLDLRSFNTNKVTDMSKMFYNCPNLTSITFSAQTRQNGASATTMEGMFKECCKLESLDLSSFSTSKVTSMRRMFAGKDYNNYIYNNNGGDAGNDPKEITPMQLRTITFGSNFDTSSVTDMAYMFLFCNSLETIDLSTCHFDTSNVTDMRWMFAMPDKSNWDPKGLKSVNLGNNFHTSNVTNMRGMFCNAFYMEDFALDLSGFDTAKVTDMGKMFKGSSKLTGLTLPSGIDTSKVTDMGEMFSGCSSLGSLDLSDFRTQNVTNMEKMFYGCSSLTGGPGSVALNLQGFDTSRVTNMADMFSSCEALTGINFGSSFYLQESAGGTSTYTGGFFRKCKALKSIVGLQLKASYSDKATNLFQDMFNGCESLVSVDITVPEGGVTFAGSRSMARMFLDCRALTSVPSWLEKIDTANVTNMSEMFCNCTSLETIDLSYFNTSMVTNMRYMFAGSGLTNLDLSRFDTTELTSMDGMFAQCKNLKTIRFNDGFYLYDGSIRSGSGTHYVGYGIFEGCSSLTGVTGFKLKESYNNIKSMERLFRGCSSLTSITLKADGGQPTTFYNLTTLGKESYGENYSMFSGCTKLETVDLSGWKVPKLESVKDLFYGCSTLKTANLSGWDTRDASGQAVLSDLTSLFEGCTALEEANLSNWDGGAGSNWSDVGGMFYGCTNSEKLTIDFSGIKLMGSQLYGVDYMVPSDPYDDTQRAKPVELKIGEYINPDDQIQKNAIIDAFIEWDTVYEEDEYGEYVPTAGRMNLLTITANGTTIYANGEDKRTPTPETPANNSADSFSDAEPEETLYPVTVYYVLGDAEPAPVAIQAALGEVIGYEKVAAEVEGFVFDRCEPKTLTVGEEENVITVYYKQAASCTVAVWCDGELEKEETLTGAVGDTVAYTPEAREGYTFTVDPASLTLGAEETPQVITVRYTSQDAAQDIPQEVPPPQEEEQGQTEQAVVSYGASPEGGKSGRISAEDVMPEANYDLPLPTTAAATPVDSIVPYIVRVKYKSTDGTQSQGRSGVIRVEFPLPEGIEPQNTDPDNLATNIEVGKVRSLTDENHYEDGAEKIAVPFKLKQEGDRYVLTGQVQGLFIGTYLDITVKCRIKEHDGNAQSQLPQWPKTNQNTEGSYWQWIGTAQAWFDGHTKTSSLRLWDFEAKPDQPETPKKALVTYEYQGSVPSGVKAPDQEMKEAGDAVTLSGRPDPSTIPSTHEFKGWYKAGTTDEPKKDLTYTIQESDLANGVKFIGVWELKETGKITVKYEYAANGEDKVPSSLEGKTVTQEVKLGTSHQILTPSNDIFGYEFAGWHKVTVGDTPKDNFPKSGELNTSDKTLGLQNGNTVVYTGAWKLLKGTIEFEPNYTGGSTPEATTQDITLIRPENLTKNTFTRDNYTFKGWSTTPDGEVEYADGASAVGLVSALDEARKKGESVTLYAVWEPKLAADYNVTYYYDGEKGSAPAGGETSGSGAVGAKPEVNYPLETTVGEKDYTFDHVELPTLESGSGNVVKVYYVSAVKVTYNEFQGDDDETTPDPEPNPNTTMVQRQKKVTAILKGGEWTDEGKQGWTSKSASSDDAPVFTRTTTATETEIELEDPTRSGYVFMGWKKTEDVDAKGQKTGDVTFTAQWKEIEAAVIEASTPYKPTYDGEPKPLTKEGNSETDPKLNNKVTVTVNGQPAADFTIDHYESEDGTPLGKNPNGTPEAPTDAGTYKAVITVKDEDGKVIGTVKVSYTVKPAVLTATYVSETVGRGGTPKGEVTVTGFVNGETAGTAEGYKAPAVDLTGVDTDTAGRHTLTPAGGAAKNYVFEYVPGTLTVTGGGGGGGSRPDPEPNPEPKPETPKPEEPKPEEPQPETPTPTNPQPGISDRPVDPDTGMVPYDPTIILEDLVPLAAPHLNVTDHFAYIVGYPNGTVKPTGNITRAEAATIFLRLMLDEYRQENWSTENDFSDVDAGAWYNNAVSTCAKAGIIQGYPDGTFRPNANITRAEFAAIAARFVSEDVPGYDYFTDMNGHWAQKDVARAVMAGWIRGDGRTFRPQDQMSRAETATLVNRMINRFPDKEHLLAEMIRWPDNLESDWFYEDVQEATNSHDYEGGALTLAEVWTGLLDNRDWAALEVQWAAAGDAPGGEVAPELQSGAE